MSKWILVFILVILSSSESFCSSELDNKIDEILSPQSSMIQPKSIKPTLKNAKFERKKLIVIDAGHGGKDSGTIGHSNMEKDVVLDMAYILTKVLKKSGYDVKMTRDSDEFIELKDRVKISDNSLADLFISIHADSSPNRKTRGLSIYTLSTHSSDKDSERLARKENKYDAINRGNLSNLDQSTLNTLIYMAYNNNGNQSAKFADILVNELVKNDINLLQKPHRFAGFMVLTSLNTPSVLVELGYLSNRDDEEMLESDWYKKRVANSISAAIDGYFKKYKF